MATEEEANKFLNQTMDQLDRAFNGPALPGIPRNVGLILMVFPMGADPATAHTSITTNGIGREHAATLMKVQSHLLMPPPPPAPPPAAEPPGEAAN